MRPRSSEGAGNGVTVIPADTSCADGVTEAVCCGWAALDVAFSTEVEADVACLESNSELAGAAALPTPAGATAGAADVEIDAAKVLAESFFSPPVDDVAGAEPPNENPSLAFASVGFESFFFSAGLPKEKPPGADAGMDLLSSFFSAGFPNENPPTLGVVVESFNSALDPEGLREAPPKLNPPELPDTPVEPAPIEDEEATLEAEIEEVAG